VVVMSQIVRLSGGLFHGRHMSLQRPATIMNVRGEQKSAFLRTSSIPAHSVTNILFVTIER
jgi:hypothetical protein